MNKILEQVYHIVTIGPPKTYTDDAFIYAKHQLYSKVASDLYFADDWLLFHRKVSLFNFYRKVPCLTLRQTVLKYCIYSWQSLAKKLELGHETWFLTMKNIHDQNIMLTKSM